MKSKIARILLWVLTVFMVLVAFAYFPSVASILAILFAVICAPVEKLQDFFRSKNLKGIVKGALLTVLFFASIMATPTVKTSPDTVNDTPEEIEEPDTQTKEPTDEAQLEDAEDSILPEETDEPQDAEAPAEEQTEPQESTEIQEQSMPDTESSAQPVQETQPDQKPQPNQEPEKTTTEPTAPPVEEKTIRGRSSNTIVYVSNSGKIHSVSDCSGMKSYREMTLGTADAKGYEYCSNCW